MSFEVIAESMHQSECCALAETGNQESNLLVLNSKYEQCLSKKIQLQQMSNMSNTDVLCEH